jgi:hypothetical protein
MKNSKRERRKKRDKNKNFERRTLRTYNILNRNTI